MNRSHPAPESHVLYQAQTQSLRGSASVTILSSVLFLSGTGALIFETLWLRLSGLAFGSSVWAAALILSSFMAGLALGNAIAASSRIRRWRPLHFYALLEVLVAFFGCTIVFVLPLLGELLRPVWQMLWNYQPALLGLRFVVSFLILLVPTTTMGLTLPVMIEDPALRQTNFGRAIGFLYGSNTLGAMAGAVLGEACLIRALGIYGTSMAAGSVVFLALEVIWFRFLRLYVASSMTAFAVMLAVVLAGIGFGGIVAGAIHRRSSRLHYLVPVLLLLSAVLVLVSYLLFPGELIPAPTGVFDLRWWQIALVGVALIFPAAFLSGMLFPSIVAEVQARVSDRMNSTGITTLCNTTGAAIGPLLASFVLLPGIGFQSSIIICAAAYALLSILVTERDLLRFVRKLAPASLAVVGLWAAIILIVIFFPYRRSEAHFQHASGVYERDNKGEVMARVVKRMEGTADTWQLLRRDLVGEPYYYRLIANAFSMSATTPRAQRYMRLFAYLPLAFRPESNDVLLLCYGCGVTADALLHGPNVKRMDIVDISKEVFAFADSYSTIDYHNPLRDPRVHTVIQDGRFFLQASPRQYDIISGEPPPPKVAGSVNLYTQEFFKLMENRLKEGGIATFWLPINQLKVEETKAILHAFHNAFSNASVWASADQEWIMMGVKGPGRKVSEEELRQLWSHPDSGADLRRVGIEVPQQLGALFLMDREEIGRITNDVAPLVDNYPKRLSDAAWDEEANLRFASAYMDTLPALQHFVHSPLIATIWPEK